MKITKFEGTAEEFKVVAHLFNDSAIKEENKQTPSGSVEAPAIDKKEAIRRMLKRLPISEGQMSVYKSLANGALDYTEFVKRTGRTNAQLAGVLGALGRRINGTKEIHQAGLPGNTKAIMNWDAGTGITGLTDYAMEVLKSEGII